MNDYIKNKSYLGLYLNSIGLKFSSSLVLSFIGADLVLQGLPLPLIFLYFGLEFFFRGVFTPLSGVLNARFGFKRTVIIANVFLGLYFVWLGLFSPHSLLGYLGFLLHSLARGIYYPTKHFMQATFVDNETRGRFLTFEIVVTAVCSVIAISFATYSVATWHTFLPPALLACLFLGLSSYSVLKLLPEQPRLQDGSYQTVWRRFVSAGFRSDRTAFIGFGFNIGFNNVVLSLLVFFVVNSLKLFGAIMAAVLLAEMILTLLYGNFIDKRRLSSHKIASGLQVFSYVTFSLALTPLLVAIIKTAYDLIWNVFDSSLTARIHQKISNEGLVYACAKEATLGLSCAAYCFALAFTAFVWREGAFAASLVIASFGVLLVWRKFSD